MKKALILSCSTGQGHNSCARAVKEYFDRQQVDCRIVDAFRFVSEKFAIFMGGRPQLYVPPYPGAVSLGVWVQQKTSGAVSGRNSDLQNPDGRISADVSIHSKGGNLIP